MPTDTAPPTRPVPASTRPSRAAAEGAPASPSGAAPSAAGVSAGSDADAQRQRIHAARAVHWARTRRITALLLALWLATGFCTVFFARDLAHMSVFGWPLSFYLAAQGASLIYLTIIGVYAWQMQRLDRDFARQVKEAA